MCFWGMFILLCVISQLYWGLSKYNLSFPICHAMGGSMWSYSTWGLQQWMMVHGCAHDSKSGAQHQRQEVENQDALEWSAGFVIWCRIVRLCQCCHIYYRFFNVLVVSQCVFFVSAFPSFLCRATSNNKVKEMVLLELSYVNSNLQLLMGQLEGLNSSVDVYQSTQ